MSFYKEFDPRDLKHWRAVLRILWADITWHHGPAIARRLFAEKVASRQEAREMSNDWLTIEYTRSGLSVKKFAAQLAEKNKSLLREHRCLNGATNVEAIEKQIRRQKKSMSPDRRTFIKYAAKYFSSDIS
jgi:hypothetical protein